MSNISILREEDVPGAKFTRKNVEEHSVRELKRWLECRGLKKTGNKKDLVERCKNCVSAGRAGILDVAVDGGKWFEQKKQSLLPINIVSTSTVITLPSTSSGLPSASTELPSTSFGLPSTSTGLPSTSSPIINFQLFPSVDIPELFNKGHIYYYLIESVPISALANQKHDSDNEADTVLSTEKPYRRGQQYIDSGHVGDMYDSYIDNKYVVKCKIKSSFKTLYYNVYIELSRFSGNIICGSCECKASSLGRCSHVCALLLSIAHHMEVNGFKALASTSKSRMWGKGSQKRAPQRIVEAQYPSAIDRIKRATFDPRAHVYQSNEATPEEVNSFTHLLEFYVPDDGRIFWQDILSYTYSDFVLTTEECKTVVDQCKMFLQNLEEFVESKPQDTFVLPNTDDQALSSTWKRWRNILVTGSKARSLLGLSKPSAKITYLRNSLWNMDQITTRNMLYGIKQEDNARKEYEIYLKSTYTNSHITTTGLWMCKKYPQFGCSPDGLVFRNGLRGILEIKCPAILENHHPKDFNSVLSSTQKSSFCLKVVDTEVVLKQNHAYYTQIQVTMAITDTTFCDFWVWSPKGFLIVEVQYDHNLCLDIFPRLANIHRHLVVPEYFLKRTVRNLKPLELDY